jgi:hypothetical protein
VEKFASHPLSRRHRADIEGCVSVDNSAVVVSVAKCDFKFPHEVDVHNIVATELLGQFLFIYFIINYHPIL